MGDWRERCRGNRQPEHSPCNAAGDEPRGGGLTTAPEVVWIDGLRCPPLDYPTRAIVDGDRLIAEIAAASILAKTTRDAVLVDLDRSYPIYGFARHKGYSTREHLAALATHGPCPAHRRYYAPVIQTRFVF